MRDDLDERVPVSRMRHAETDKRVNKHGLLGLALTHRRFRGQSPRLLAPPRVRAGARLRALSFGYRVRSRLAARLHTKSREVGRR